MAGDDHALDLGSALIDLGDLGITHHALHGILTGVAVAAEQLHGTTGHVGSGIGSGKHKILNAVLVYLVIYVVRNIVGTMILLIPPLTFTMTDTGFGVYISEFAAANLVLGAVMIYELVFCAVYYCLIYFSMKKHLNL